MGKRRPSPVYNLDYRYMIAKLRQARRKADLTLVQVGKMLGRHHSFVARCESGERRIDPVELRTFAKIYRRPLTFFFPPERGKGP